MPRSLDILIVNWNTKGLLEGLLESLRDTVRAEASWKVIVVDNGSTDGSADMVAGKYPWVLLVRSTVNIGYAGGNNLALKHGTGEYALLLNTDTEGTNPSTVGAMLDYMESHPRCAAVGPALILTDGSPQTGAAGYDLTLRAAFHYFFFLSRLFPESCKGFYIDQRHWIQRGEPLKVDWVSGAALMARRRALEEVGGIPTDYFMYAEDVQLCRLLREKGRDIYYLPNVQIRHHHGASTNTPADRATWVGSTISEFGSRSSPLGGLLMKGIFCGGFFFRYAAYSAAALLGRGGDSRMKAMAMKSYFRAALRFAPGSRV